MSRKIMGVVLTLFLSLLGVGALTMSASADVNEDKNHTSYWEALGYGTCVKVENPGGTSVTLAAAPAGQVYTILVVKAGSEQSVENPNLEYLNPVTGTAYASPGGKTVSHYIYCYKPTTVQSTPASTPVTTPASTPASTPAEKETETQTPGVLPTKKAAPKPNKTTPAPEATATETAVPQTDTLANTGGAQSLLLAAIGAGLVAAGALFYSLTRRPGRH